MYRYLFFVPGKELKESDMTKYEFWLDADYANRVSTNGTGAEVWQTIDISNLSQGIHYLNFRAYSSSEGLCPMYRNLFFVSEIDNSLEQLESLEYWLDDSEESLQKMPKGNSNELEIVVDISHLQTDTTHYFNIRGINKNKTIGLFKRFEFFYPNDSLSLLSQTIQQAETDLQVQRNRLTAIENKLMLLQDLLMNLALRCDTLQGQYAHSELSMTDTERTDFKQSIDQSQETVLNLRMTCQACIDTLIVLKQRADTISDDLTALKTRLLTATTQDELQAVYALITEVRMRLDSFIVQVDAEEANVTACYESTEALVPIIANNEQIMKENIIGITYDGMLRTDQLSRLQRYPHLRRLDISLATIEGNQLPSKAFSSLQQLVSIKLPCSVTSTGSSLFADCPALAAIVWTSNTDIPTDAMNGIENPNLLLYVIDYAQALGISIKNIISNGIAQKITLTDNVQEDGSFGPANFYAPQAFRVQNEISYTHQYKQTTKVNECRGWETIALPFTVQSITHETNGACIPFASYVPGMKPFWLCQLTEQGFVDADSIRANTPYIISMPESEEYSPHYRLGGKITFSARSVIVPATAPQISTRGNASFIPNFQTVAASQSVYALNVGEERSGFAEGSLFDRNYRQVRPFEAYRTTTQTGLHYMPIAEDLGVTTHLDKVVTRNENDVFYNLQGLPVNTPSKGVYIKNGKKVVRSIK